jgi:hypothetical protein
MRNIPAINAIVKSMRNTTNAAISKIIKRLIRSINAISI